jgi:hypothetical protein
MCLDRFADRAVVGFRHCFQPFAALLGALLRGDSAFGPPCRAKSTMGDGIPIARLAASHSFLRFSRNLRRFALDYGTGVRCYCSMDFIPPAHQSTRT